MSNKNKYKNAEQKVGQKRGIAEMNVEFVLVFACRGHSGPAYSQQCQAH